MNGFEVEDINVNKFKLSDKNRRNTEESGADNDTMEAENKTNHLNKTTKSNKINDDKTTDMTNDRIASKSKGNLVDNSLGVNLAATENVQENKTAETKAKAADKAKNKPLKKSKAFDKPKTKSKADDESLENTINKATPKVKDIEKSKKKSQADNKSMTNSEGRVENINEGHRERLRKRLMAIDFTQWEEHEALEFMLFGVMTRAYTNRTAHRLLNKFGSFKNMFGSSVTALCEVEGINERGAETILLYGKLLSFLDWTEASGIKTLSTFEEAERLLVGALSSSTNEDLTVIGINSRYEILFQKIIRKVTPHATNMSFREILRLCFAHHALAVIISHSHPGGRAEPSGADDRFTETLVGDLHNFGIHLFDHIIVASDKAYSYQTSGKLEEFRNNLGIDYSVTSTNIVQKVPLTYANTNDD